MRPCVGAIDFFFFFSFCVTDSHVGEPPTFSLTKISVFFLLENSSFAYVSFIYIVSESI